MSRNSYIVTMLVVLSLLGSAIHGWAQPTPPIMPQVTETPLPPPVTLPAPDGVPADVPDTPLTAQEAARIALHHQPSIAVATQGALAAQARLQQARSGQAPALVVSSGFSNGTSLSGGDNNGNDFNTGATVRKLLFDFNHTRDLVRQSTAQTQSAQANLTRAQSDTVFQVKQAYYNYAQALRLIDVNEANLQNRQTHLAQTEARVKAGVGLPIDVVRAQTAVAEAILNLTVARNAAEVARINLAQLMGLDPRTPIQIAEDEEPAVTADDVNALLQTAIKQRPEMLQAQANLQASGYGVSAAKTTNSPTLVGSLGLGMRGAGIPTDNNALTAGVALQWSPFDGGLAAGRIKEAKANQESAKATLESTRLSVMSDVTQAYMNDKTAEQRLVTATAQVTNAEEALRLAQGRYNAGLGVFLDVLDAQATLVSAQTNRVNAQSAINQARAALAHALNSDSALAAPVEVKKAP